MFDVIVKPVINAVRAWMSARVYEAAQEGAREGLARFTEGLTLSLTDRSPAGFLTPAEAVPLPMPAAAQVTDDGGGTCPAEDVVAYERLKELIDAGYSQREAARQLGVPESTARGWLKRAGGAE